MRNSSPCLSATQLTGKGTDAVHHLGRAASEKRPSLAFWRFFGGQTLAPEREPPSSSQNSPERPNLLYTLFSALGVLWLLSKFSAPNNKTSKTIGPQDTPE